MNDIQNTVNSSITPQITPNTRVNNSSIFSLLLPVLLFLAFFLSLGINLYQYQKIQLLVTKSLAEQTICKANKELDKVAVSKEADTVFEQWKTYSNEVRNHYLK